MSLASNLQEAAECQCKDHEDDQKCQENHEETGPKRPVDVPAKVSVGRVHILVDVGGEEAKHLIGTVLVLLDRFDRELHPLVEGVIVIEGLLVFVDGTFRAGAILNIVGIVAVPESIDAGLLCVGGSYRRIGGSFRTIHVVILRTRTIAVAVFGQDAGRQGSGDIILHIPTHVGLPSEPPGHRLPLCLWPNLFAGEGDAE